MASTGHYLATSVAVNVMSKGGNAIDAGVAAGLTINVVQPDMTSFGGVAPMIIYDANEDTVKTISGLGYWPKAATAELFRSRFGGEIPLGALRSIVPAAPDAWLTAIKEFGTMPFSEVVRYAFEAAKNGFPAYGSFVANVKTSLDQYKLWSSSKAVFLPHGKPPMIGQLIIQPDLARTFKRLMRIESEADGDREAKIQAVRDELYSGSIANEIVSFCKSQGGLLSKDDLESFAVVIEKPLVTSYNGYNVLSCGPWCQGPVLLQALNILANFNLQQLEHNSPNYIHLLTEALNLSFADREAFYGDPKQVDVPIETLISKEYARLRTNEIDLKKARTEMAPAGKPFFAKKTLTYRSRTLPKGTSNDTSYVCTIDKEGNGFSCTPSDPGNDSPLVPGLGFIISPRGSQSYLDEEHPNKVAPRKRPRMTPNPSMVFKDDRLFMTFGTPGADMQVQAMLQMFLNLTVFDADVQQAIEAPRFGSLNFPFSFWPHEYRPGSIILERGIPSETVHGLRRLGYKTLRWPGLWHREAGGVCAIVKDYREGLLIGGADPRRECYAVGW